LRGFDPEATLAWIMGPPSRLRAALRSHVVTVAAALALTSLAYAGALGTFFAHDDVTHLSRAAGPISWNGWVRPLSEVIAFRLQHAVFGLDPFGYHLVNLLLHLANTALVYVLGVRLGGIRSIAGIAAILFGTSSIAFTPVHWVTGVIDLLATSFLLAATVLWVEGRGRGAAWRWSAACVALAAMFSKETAVAWVLAAPLIEWRIARRRPTWRGMLPALLAGLVFGLVFLATGQARRLEAQEAYAFTSSPWFIAQNLSTYLRWCVALNDPIRDVVAAADPSAWRVGLPLALALGAVLWRGSRTAHDVVAIGLGWWLVFLLPVLPLTHHSYLYYLYIPWVGGALAAAGLGHALLARWPWSQRVLVGLALLAALVSIEARNIRVRRTATRDALPVDRTMRDAVLLNHALPAFEKAALPPGTRVAFVNPVPGPRFDLMTGAPTRSEALASRASYFPLEAALRGGETMRLFVPGLVYLGFANTIPAAWEDAECFYFEQRGWLEPWGRGQGALMHQASVQMAAERWKAAESTLVRVRALGDTLPTALEWQIRTLAESGRRREAGLVAQELRRRWPAHRDAVEAR
jgi:hypothetical protein